MTEKPNLWQEVFWLADETHPYPVEKWADKVGLVIAKAGRGDGDPAAVWSRLYGSWATAAIRDDEAVAQFVKIINTAAANGYTLVDATSETAALAGLSSDERGLHMLRSDTPTGALLWTATRPGGELHFYPHDGDVGLDLAATFSDPLAVVTLQPGQVYDIPTGVAVELPTGTWGFIHGRSSALTKGIGVHSGVIDNGFRGELLVRCTALHRIEVEHGDRLAQLILMPVVRATELAEVQELGDSSRGTDGFGSTG